MPAAESLVWVAAVTVVIWLGIFVLLPRPRPPVRRLEEEQ